MVWALSVVSSEVSDPDVAVQHCRRIVARVSSNRLCLEELGGLGPDRRTQRAGVHRVIGRRSLAIGFRPPGDLSGDLT